MFIGQAFHWNFNTTIISSTFLLKFIFYGKPSFSSRLTDVAWSILFQIFQSYPKLITKKYLKKTVNSINFLLKVV